MAMARISSGKTSLTVRYALEAAAEATKKMTLQHIVCDVAVKAPRALILRPAIPVVGATRARAARPTRLPRRLKPPRRAEYRTPLWITGDGGMAGAEDALTVDHPIRLEIKPIGANLITEQVSNDRTYADQVDAFALHIEQAIPFAAPATEGLRNQQVIDAAYRSIKSGSGVCCPATESFAITVLRQKWRIWSQGAKTIVRNPTTVVPPESKRVLEGASVEPHKRNKARSTTGKSFRLRPPL